MEEMIAEIKQKQAEIKRLQKELQDKSSEIFLSSFKNLFEETPKLKSFAWSQYTPYFNDGDTCYFSANTDYLTINGDNDDDDEDEDDDARRRVYCGKLTTNSFSLNNDG